MECVIVNRFLVAQRGLFHYKFVLLLRCAASSKSTTEPTKRRKKPNTHVRNFYVVIITL